MEKVENKTYTEFLAVYGIGAAHPGGLGLTKQLLAEEALTPNHVILDVGCGTGKSSAYIANTYGCHVVACDANEKMIKQSRQLFEDQGLTLKSIIAKTEDLPFKGDQFDLILSESVTNFTNIASSLKQYARVLKPDGHLIAIEMTREMNMTPEEIDRLKGFYGVTAVLSEKEWMDQFRAAGFQEIEVKQGMAIRYHDDEDHGTEFEFNDSMDPAYLDILSEHLQLTSEFADKLGYRVFKCGL